MILKKLISITLILVSFSIAAEATETLPLTDKKTDSTQSVQKDAETPSSENSPSTTKNSADTCVSPQKPGETINITVTIHAKDVAGVGYSVEGKESGEAGNSHSGVGPSNKTYSFGYRKRPKLDENIPCGSTQLTKDSKVTLIVEGEHCHLRVE